MAKFKLANYTKGDFHQGEHGNKSILTRLITVPAGAVAADELQVQNVSWNTHYHSAKVYAKLGALVAPAGLTVALMAMSTEGNGAAPFEIFAAASAAAATGNRDNLLAASHMSMDVANGRGYLHDLVLVLGGTVTAGMEFYLTLEYVYESQP